MGWRRPIAVALFALTTGCGPSTDDSTDASGGATSSGDSTGAPETGTSTQGATDTPTSGPTDASSTDASTTDASTTDASTTDASTTDASTTTGGSGGIDAACEAVCELWLMCEPEVYPDVETCAAACVEQAPGLPACEPQAAVYNECLGGLTCDEWAMALHDMQFGRCTDAYDAYAACL